MRSVLETCVPRPELIQGSFNPEIFTASLSPVLEHYRGKQTTLDSIYTDAIRFFTEGTYATQGLRSVLHDIFARISGDNSAPATQRLETAFGGGKTHSLIAATHIARRGKELKNVTADLLPPEFLPEPGSVAVVGIAGDELPVQKPQGEALVPYTIWGEIARQIGGDALYKEVEAEATSYAAPGKTYFAKVLGGRKALIMLDELAQYAARLEAARTDGAEQLSAFLMSLLGFARTNTGIAVVITLASAADAFGKQTEALLRHVSAARGAEVSVDEAMNIGQRAVRGVGSVVSRDAVQITPVQGGEIAAVLAKRLFLSIDREAAAETAAAYSDLYQRNSADLPDQAPSHRYQERMVANYPFHPSLVDFLNQRLTSAENFQGTRGVLRVLALAVRSLWQKKLPVPMIHAPHLDLRNERVVNELLGRTGSSDLLFVLNADIGGVDTGNLEGGASNAELADQANPHPNGYPLFEYTWKTVFLHSLVGRDGGIASNLFGITQPDALLAVSHPGLTPSQVRMALEEIPKRVFYLRSEQGKFFASEKPTLNSALAKIQRAISSNQVEQLLKDAAHRLVKDGGGIFQVVQDVAHPEEIPDGKGRPTLAIISPVAKSLNVEAMITTKGPNKPREEQNLAFLLAPSTVPVTGSGGHQQELPLADSQAEKERQRIADVARQVRALQMLKENPQNWGVNPNLLDEPEFKERFAERSQALQTAVSGAYDALYFPSTQGFILRKEIKSASGESGAPLIAAITQLLLQDKELLNAQSTTTSDLKSLADLFFPKSDVVSIKQIRTNFACQRAWPVLEKPEVLEQIIRAGVEKGNWSLYRMGSSESTKPAELYHTGAPVPLSANLAGDTYSLITVEGAAKRGWMAEHQVDPEKVKSGLHQAVVDKGQVALGQLKDLYKEQHGEAPAKAVTNAMAELVKKGQLLVFRESTVAGETPAQVAGLQLAVYVPSDDDVIVTPAEAAERGWVKPEEQGLHLSGAEAVEKVLPLLKQLGSIYSRGAKSQVDTLDLVDLTLPAGGTLRLTLSDATPASLKALQELFEVLVQVAKPGEATDVYLDINSPHEDCLFVQAVTKTQK